MLVRAATISPELPTSSAWYQAALEEGGSVLVLSPRKDWMAREGVPVGFGSAGMTEQSRTLLGVCHSQQAEWAGNRTNGTDIPAQHR